MHYLDRFMKFDQAVFGAVCPTSCRMPEDGQRGRKLLRYGEQITMLTRVVRADLSALCG